MIGKFMKFRVGFWLPLVSVLTVSACRMGIIDANMIEIRVYQQAGQLAFEFYRQERGWWSNRLVPERVSFLSLHLPGGEPTIWLVKSTKRDSDTSRVIYSVVPEGFTQVVPANGSVPTLEPDRKYSVSVESNASKEPWVGATSFVYRKP